MGDEQMYQNVFTAMEKYATAADDLEHGGGDETDRDNSLNIGTRTPSFYLCPSADVMTKALGEGYSDADVWGHDEWISKGNYAACFGSDTYVWAANPHLPNPATAGAFGVVMLNNWKKNAPNQVADDPAMFGVWKMGHNQGVTMAEIRDGASNTLAVSEVIGYDSGRDARGGWVINVPGSSLFMARTTPNSLENDVTSVCDDTIPAFDRLHCTEKRGKGDDIWAAARSSHRGGVNAVMADSSAHFFSDAVDSKVWGAMATRMNAANEVAPTIE